MAEAWAKTFYNSKAWKDFRQSQIIANNYTCRKCGKNFLFDSSNLIGHHKIELTSENINNPNITLNPANVEIICADCHNAEHKRGGYNTRRQVFLVYGAPCSGKSTFVNQTAERGDLIVDLNRIRSAIGIGTNDGDKALSGVVFAMRDALLEQVKLRAGGWQSAFVVGGYPRKFERERLAARLGAELVFCDVSKEEAKLRAAVKYKQLADVWQKFIDKWFDDFQP